MLNQLQKGIGWVEYEFLQNPEDPGDGTFIHLRKREGDFRLDLVSMLGDASKRVYVVDIQHGFPDCDEWTTMCWVLQKDVEVVAGLMQDALAEIRRTPADRSSPFWLRRGLE